MKLQQFRMIRIVSPYLPMQRSAIGGRRLDG